MSVPDVTQGHGSPISHPNCSIASVRDAALLLGKKSPVSSEAVAGSTVVVDSREGVLDLDSIDQDSKAQVEGSAPTPEEVSEVQTPKPSEGPDNLRSEDDKSQNTDSSAGGVNVLNNVGSTPPGGVSANMAKWLEGEAVRHAFLSNPINVYSTQFRLPSAANRIWSNPRKGREDVVPGTPAVGQRPKDVSGTLPNLSTTRFVRRTLAGVLPLPEGSGSPIRSMDLPDLHDAALNVCIHTHEASSTNSSLAVITVQGLHTLFANIHRALELLIAPERDPRISSRMAVEPHSETPNLDRNWWEVTKGVIDHDINNIRNITRLNKQWPTLGLWPSIEEQLLHPCSECDTPEWASLFPVGMSGVGSCKCFQLRVITYGDLSEPRKVHIKGTFGNLLLIDACAEPNHKRQVTNVRLDFPLLNPSVNFGLAARTLLNVARMSSITDPKNRYGSYEIDLSYLLWFDLAAAAPSNESWKRNLVAAVHDGRESVFWSTNVIQLAFSWHIYQSNLSSPSTTVSVGDWSMPKIINIELMNYGITELILENAGQVGVLDFKEILFPAEVALGLRAAQEKKNSIQPIIIALPTVPPVVSVPVFPIVPAPSVDGIPPSPLIVDVPLPPPSSPIVDIPPVTPSSPIVDNPEPPPSPPIVDTPQPPPSPPIVDIPPPLPPRPPVVDGTSVPNPLGWTSSASCSSTTSLSAEELRNRAVADAEFEAEGKEEEEEEEEVEDVREEPRNDNEPTDDNPQPLPFSFKDFQPPLATPQQIETDYQTKVQISDYIEESNHIHTLPINIPTPFDALPDELEFKARQLTSHHMTTPGQHDWKGNIELPDVQDEAIRFTRYCATRTKVKINTGVRHGQIFGDAPFHYPSDTITQAQAVSGRLGAIKPVSSDQIKIRLKGKKYFFLRPVRIKDIHVPEEFIIGPVEPGEDLWSLEEDSIKRLIANMGKADSRKRMLKLMSALMGAQVTWDDANSKFSVFVKSDDKIAKHKARLIQFVPGGVWMKVMYRLDAILKKIKKKWSWYDKRIQTEFVWASGMTQEMLSKHLTRAMSKFINVMFACGDDNTDAFGCKDASMYDSTQRGRFATLQKEFLLKLGFTKSEIDMMWDFHQGKRSAVGFNYQQDDICLPSGAAWTLFVNTIGLIIYQTQLSRVKYSLTANGVKFTEAEAIKYASELLGLTMTFEAPPNLDSRRFNGSEFLKGIFVGGKKRSYWVPTPSRLHKWSSKIFGDLAESKKFSDPKVMQAHFKGVAQGQDPFILDPLSRIWVDHWKNVGGRATPPAWEYRNISSGTFSKTPFTLDPEDKEEWIKTWEIIMESRYGISPEEYAEMRKQLAAHVGEFGVFSGKSWSALWRRDYLGDIHS